MHLIVGCPVSHREWILQPWFDHVARAVEIAGVEATFLFVCHPDDPSRDCITAWAPFSTTILDAPFHRGVDQRRWNPERYGQMVELRNQLLRGVRERRPDLFLSLDSDILLHPDQLKFMVECLDRFDAVGGRCYMTPSGTRFPSWGRLNRGMLQRHDAEGTFSVDVIMACKLMTPFAYGVDYAVDLQGEDIGWSRNATAAGVRLGWDGRVIAKHVLAPHLLTPRDPRVGF